MTKRELIKSVRSCFDEAEAAQGSKHPDEIDLLREDVAATRHLVLRLVKTTPVEQLRKLGLVGFRLNFDGDLT